MPKLNVQSIKPLNKTINYPNFYFKLHEGITDSAVASIVCESTGIPLTVAAPGATQWGAALGNFEPAALNTTQFITTGDVSANAAAFDAVVADLQTSAWMVAVNIDYVRDNAAGEAFFGLRDQAAGKHVIDFRLNPAVGQLDPILYDSTGSVVTQSNKVTDAQGEVFLVAYIDARIGYKSSTVYNIGVGTKVHNIVSAQTRSISSNTFITPASTAGAGAITIGARKIGASTFDKVLDVAGIRDLRMINFGQTPPDDITAFIDELAINRNTGTRREY